MSSPSPQVAQSAHARAALALGALLIAGLAGCASDLSSPLNYRSADAEAYGVFTGEFVDGLPLYRFQTIVVIGSRRSLSRAPNQDESADQDN